MKLLIYISGNNIKSITKVPIMSRAYAQPVQNSDQVQYKGKVNKPCAFASTPQGCKFSGKKCRYNHEICKFVNTASGCKFGERCMNIHMPMAMTATMAMPMSMPMAMTATMAMPMAMPMPMPMAMPMPKPMAMPMPKAMAKTLDLNNLRGRVLNGYEIIHELGSGAHSKVWLAKSPSGDFVAIKVCTGHVAVLTQNEVTVFEALQALGAARAVRHARDSGASGALEHPNIVKMLGTFPHPTDRDGLCIVMEYVGYSEITERGLRKYDGVNLLSFITSPKYPFRSLPKQKKNELVRSITRQGASGLLEVNDAGYIHADPKPENFLVDSYNPLTNEITVKLCDLGNALSTSDTSYTECQTLYYRAPEVVERKRNCIRASIDMWSLGCIICELWFGTPLFDHPNDATHISAIKRFVQPDHIESIRTVIDDELLHSLIAGLLKFKPEERLTATEVITMIDSFKN